MKKILLLNLLLVITTTIFCQSDESIAVEKVKGYLKEILSSNIDDQFDINRNWVHPDAVWLEGLNPNVYVVSKEYSILKTETKMMNINLMEELDENIVLVEVLFPTIGYIENGEFLPQRSNFIRTYYFSKTTGELKILDMTKAGIYTATLPAALNWVKTRVNKTNYYEKAFKSLTEISER